MSRRAIADLRVELGRDAVVSVAEAARRLPGRDADARRWLHAEGLVAELPTGQAVVVWGCVLEAVQRYARGAPERSSRDHERSISTGQVFRRADLGGR